SGSYRLDFKESVEASISMPTEDLPEPANQNVRIVGTPIVVTLAKGGEEEQLVNVSMPYFLEEGDDELSVAIYARRRSEDGDEKWTYIGGIVDTERNVVHYEVDIARFAEEGKVVLAPISVFCPDCEVTEFRNAFTPNPDSRQAILLVHGLWTAADVWDSLITDFKLTNQPYQIWTFSYLATKPIEESAVDLANYLEANQHRVDRIDIVGYSLGGFIPQQALTHAYNEKQADPESYKFLDKVDKMIIIGTPNQGSPVAEYATTFISEYVNREATEFLPLHPVVEGILKKGIDLEPVPGVDYYVIAGTKSYEFMDNLGMTWLLFGDELNDGIVSVKSAQQFGETVFDEKCVNFWSSPVVHTLLNDDPYIYELIGQIISSDIYSQLTTGGYETNLFGFTNNIQVDIESCSPGDVYVVIGKEAIEVERPAYCACGNGLCDGVETAVTCPEDCLIVEKPMNLWWIIALLMLLITTGVGITVRQYYKKAFAVDELSVAIKDVFSSLMPKAPAKPPEVVKETLTDVNKQLEEKFEEAEKEVPEIEKPEDFEKVDDKIDDLFEDVEELDEKLKKKNKTKKRKI
ncbi:alpha/beta hydrolase, partial [Candidatus Woesearchaeota archaeon]|nr:alpha/beta hydrolase [Candidatus Woesearchaeota archaeon]